ncbi:hypothetical protein C8Q80DRAFT_1265526 [Daedaleopsis nitida]|nr:hypothetical protein C8Q80DRAFT_1265526 [Daedaleopsis nitida]
MGQAFSDIKDPLLNDPAKKEDVQILNESMDRLVEVAELRLDVFKAELATKDQLHIPIDRILYSDYRIHCQVTSDAGSMKKAIEGSIGAFVSGKIVEGLLAITGITLDALLGNISGTSARRQVYAIGVGPLGGVYRIDAQFYMYQFKSRGLKDHLKYVLATAIVISSADVRGMKRNEVKNLVQNAYAQATPEVQREIYKDIWASINEDQAGDARSLALPPLEHATAMKAAVHWASKEKESKKETSKSTVPNGAPAPGSEADQTQASIDEYHTAAVDHDRYPGGPVEFLYSEYC